MHKIIQITDTHLVPPGQTLFGIDPATRLRKVLAHSKYAHADADAIVITGDLVDTGDRFAYKLLHDILDDVPIPIYLTIGNHDNRIAFREIFGGDGFVQTTFGIGNWCVLVLDTNDAGMDCGALDGGRLQWLDEQLAAAKEKPVLIAMHHTPSNFHAPFFGVEDDMKDPGLFLRVIKKYGNVRHLLFGHRHLSVAGSFCGIPFTASRGTSHHIALDFQQHGRSMLVAAAPSYDVVFLSDESVVVHSHHGLDTYHAIRAGDVKNELYAVA